MKKMSTLSIIALFLIFLGGVGAILLTISQSISSTADKTEIINTTKSENIVLKKDLSEIKKERDLLNQTLEARDSNIQKQSEQIITLNQKLAEKSDYIQNYLTGGNGFPFLDMREFPQKGDNQQNFLFQLENDFDFPLYNIKITVFDYDKIKKNIYTDKLLSEKHIKIDDYKDAKILETDFSEIPAKQYITIDQQFPVRSGNYYITIHCRNLTIVEKITVLRIGQGNYYGFQVLSLKEDILKQDIKDEMPKEIKTKIIESLNSIPNNLKVQLIQ